MQTFKRVLVGTVGACLLAACGQAGGPLAPGQADDRTAARRHVLTFTPVCPETCQAALGSGTFGRVGTENPVIWRVVDNAPDLSDVRFTRDGTTFAGTGLDVVISGTTVTVSGTLADISNAANTRYITLVYNSVGPVYTITVSLASNQAGTTFPITGFGSILPDGPCDRLPEFNGAG